LEATELFLNSPLPKLKGWGCFSLSGGQIGLVADLAQNLGLEFPLFTEKGKNILQNILPPYATIATPGCLGQRRPGEDVSGCVAAVASEPHISLIAAARDTPPAVAAREWSNPFRLPKP